MSSKQRPPKGQSWIWLTRDMVASEAWLSLTINGRRLLDFLMLEHMRHGAKANGKLVAPRVQLAQFGIGRRFISGAIDEVEKLGFVDAKHGTGRTPNTYALTWLPLFDGTEPTNRWSTVMGHQGNQLPMGHHGDHQMVPKVTNKARSGSPREPTTAVVGHLRRGHEGDHPYRKDSYQGGDNTDSGTRGKDASQRDWLLVTDPEGEA